MPVDLMKLAVRTRQTMLDNETATIAELAASMTASERKKAERYVFWIDHGMLRTFWTNFAEVDTGVFRSNHPPHRRLEAYRDLGIKAILNLRGAPKKPHHILEVDSCAKLGLELRSIALHARFAATTAQLLELFEAFDNIPRPFLMHCKSGADRAGMASALYILDQGGTVDEARAQLSFRFLHIKRSKTGIQDHLLDLYEERLKKSPISIRDWIAKEYSPVELTESFAKIPRLPI